MNIELIATGVITVLAPYLTKSAEKVSEKIGEDLWTKIKQIFNRDKRQELLEKANENKINKDDLVEIKNYLVKHMKEDSKFKKVLKTSLNIKTTNEFILETNLQVITKIREELKVLYMEKIDAGVAVEGDYNVKISQLERKLKQIDNKILSIITKQ